MYAEMNILIKHRHSSFHLFLELYSSSVPGPFCGRVSKSLPFLSVTIDNESDPIFSDHKISPRYDQNIAEKLVQKSAEFNIDLKAKNNDYKTAFQLSRYYGKRNIVEILKKKNQTLSKLI